MKTSIGSHIVDLSQVVVIEYDEDSCEIYFSGSRDSYLPVLLKKEQLIELMEKASLRVIDVEDTFLLVQDQICAIQADPDEDDNYEVFFKDGSSESYAFGKTVAEMKSLFNVESGIEENEEETDEDELENSLEPDQTIPFSGRNFASTQTSVYRDHSELMFSKEPNQTTPFPSKNMARIKSTEKYSLHGNQQLKSSQSSTKLILVVICLAIGACYFLTRH